MGVVKCFWQLGVGAPLWLLSAGGRHLRAYLGGGLLAPSPLTDYTELARKVRAAEATVTAPMKAVGAVDVAWGLVIVGSVLLRFVGRRPKKGSSEKKGAKAGSERPSKGAKQ